MAYPEGVIIRGACEVGWRPGLCKVCALEGYLFQLTDVALSMHARDIPKLCCLEVNKLPYLQVVQVVLACLTEKGQA